MSDKYNIIAVDAMGGDNAPAEVVKGAAQALMASETLKIRLYGDEMTISAEIAKLDTKGAEIAKNRLEICPTTQVLENTDEPMAFRDKPDSSLVRAVQAVKAAEADGIVSAGNTGAFYMTANTYLRKVKGIRKACLGVEIPCADGGKMLLLDVGALADPLPEDLLIFARMGHFYMQEEYGIENPTVGLVNIGVEEHKGNTLAHSTYVLFEENREALNFQGNIESREIFNHPVDVLCTDAFTGNVLLKTIEGTAGYMKRFLKEGAMGSLRTKLGALLMKPVFNNMKAKLSSQAVGGTPFIGLRGLVIKAHGNSDAGAFCQAILRAESFAKKDFINKLAEAME